MKQDIRINVAYSRPNGWTDWADFFLWTLMGGRGMLKAKINLKFIILNFHFFPRLVSIKKRKIIKFK